jgi:hypothetical protein
VAIGIVKWSPPMICEPGGFCHRQFCHAIEELASDSAETTDLQIPLGDNGAVTDSAIAARAGFFYLGTADPKLSPPACPLRKHFLLGCASHVVVPVHERTLWVGPPGPDVKFEERRYIESVWAIDELKTLTL